MDKCVECGRERKGPVCGYCNPKAVSWTDKWPTKKGLYWFYGYRFTPFKDEKPELCLVEVFKIVNGVAHVTKGHFLYKEEGATGLFTPAECPPVPEDPLEIMLLGVKK